MAIEATSPCAEESVEAPPEASGTALQHSTPASEQTAPDLGKADEAAAPSADPEITHRLFERVPLEYRDIMTVPDYHGGFESPEIKERYDKLVTAFNLLLTGADDDAVVRVSPVKLRQFERLVDNIFQDHAEEDRIRGMEAFVYRLKKVHVPKKPALLPKGTALIDLVPEAYLDIETWPPYDSSILKGKGKGKRLTRYDKYVVGAKLILAGETLAKAAEAAGVTEGQFRIVFQIAMEEKEGEHRIMGFEAFAGWLSPRGRTTDFKKLLKRYPLVEARLLEWLNSRHRINKLEPSDLRAQFRLIVDEIVPEGVYPRNTEDYGRRPLWDWFLEEYLPRYGKRYKKHEVGQAAADVANYAEGDGQSERARGPFTVWSCDEYTIDAKLQYEFESIFGGDEHIVLPRIPLLVVSETTWGNVLAWRLVIAKQVTAEDICITFFDAVAGQARVAQVLPDEIYLEAGGYAASVYAKVRWLAPRLFLLDNALSHLANSVQTTLERVFGARVRMGRAATPKARAATEAHFKDLAMRLVRNLPEATGSHPRDPIRQAALRGVLGRLDVAVFENLLCSYFHNSNGRPKAGAGNIPPLERLGRVITKNQLGNCVHVPEEKRNLYWFSAPITRTVKCSKDKRHPRPNHINWGVRYTSHKLQREVVMLNQKLTIRPNYRNLQTVLAFANGKFYDVLYAEGIWGRIPHDLRIRRTFRTLHHLGALGERPNDRPLQALWRYLCDGAPSDPVIAAKRAYIVKYLTDHYEELKLEKPDIEAAIHRADELAANDSHALYAGDDDDDEDSEDWGEDEDGVAVTSEEAPAQKPFSRTQSPTAAKPVAQPATRTATPSTAADTSADSGGAEIRQFPHAVPRPAPVRSAPPPQPLASRRPVLDDDDGFDPLAGMTVPTNATRRR